MKGWVYIITNKSMPGLLKVGFSTKDPALRAAELSGSGLPHQYEVEYEILVTDPYEVEQTTHGLLAARSEAKEWFRCAKDEAVLAIKTAAGDRTFIETFNFGEVPVQSHSLPRSREAMEKEVEYEAFETYFKSLRARTRLINEGTSKNLDYVKARQDRAIKFPDKELERLKCEHFYCPTCKYSVDINKVQLAFSPPKEVICHYCKKTYAVKDLLTPHALLFPSEV